MAYEELIRKAKEYLAPEGGEFESYYRKAAEISERITTARSRS